MKNHNGRNGKAPNMERCEYPQCVAEPKFKFTNWAGDRYAYCKRHRDQFVEDLLMTGIRSRFKVSVLRRGGKKDG